MRRALAFAAVFALLAASTASQQLSAPPFRLEVNYVEVDAIATDRDGRFVADLQREDFQILEDGRPQAIALFSRVDLSTDAKPPPQSPSTVDPDVSINTRPPQARLFVLVLDDVHTHPLRTPHVKAAARRFTDRHLSPGDLVAVVHTSGAFDTTQDFTTSRAQLARAIDRFTGRRLPSAAIEVLDDHQRGIDPRKPRTPMADPRTLQRADDARTTLRTLQRLADSLSSIQGRRKVIAYFSEGIDADLHDFVNNRDASAIASALRDVVSAATRANVIIYSVDARGLTNLGDQIAETQAVPLDPHLQLGPPALLGELKRSQDSLRILAEQTGGFAVVDTNDIPAALQRIASENSQYYVLGYYSTNQRRDGRFRKIDVRTNRPGLTITARRGYIAPDDDPPSGKQSDSAATRELATALDRMLPTSGLSLSATAAVFRGPGTEAPVIVAVEANGRELGFASKNDKLHDTIELSMLAVDGAGTVRQRDRHDVSVELGPETHSRVKTTGLRLLTRVNLTPGRYQLRIAARDSATGAIGTVFHDVEVPDFPSLPLSMSSLVVAPAPPGIPTVRVGNSAESLPMLPSATRDFTAADDLMLFAEIYDQAITAHRVDTTATVRAEDGRVMFRHHQESESGADGKRGFGYVAQIRLDGMPPGRYVVAVEAVSRLSNGGRMIREVPFRIRP